MDCTDLECEYNELQKEYDELQKDHDKLQKEYDDLCNELNIINSRVDDLVESKVTTLLDKMLSFNNQYSEYSTVEECGDLLFHLADDIERYYNDMSMTVRDIVKTNVLELIILLTFYSYTLSYKNQDWLKKIIIEEFINILSRKYSISSIAYLSYVQRKTLRDIIINEKIDIIYELHFPVKQEHVSMILKLTCTNRTTDSIYTRNKQHFNKEIIESLDIDKELKENILFQYKKDILKGNIK